MPGLAHPLPLFLFATVCTLLPAQEGGPAKELERYQPLIGHWQASGTMRPAADGQPTRWTGHTTARRVLGGHFVQEDTLIDLGEAAPTRLALRTFYGYDRERKRWVSYMVSNMGGVVEAQVHWVDGKMITAGAELKMGDLVIERWTTTFGEDSYTLSSYEAHGDGKPFQHVTGTFKRAQAVDAASDAKVQAFFPVAAEMGFLSKFAGKYRITGWMAMAADQDKVDIAATETASPAFGGTGVSFVLVGDPVKEMGNFSYGGWGLMTWNPDRKTYQSLWLDNMGISALADAHRVGDKLVVGAAMTMQGAPTVTHSVFETNADGSLASVREHKIIGAGKPFHAFQATYKKQ